MTEGWWGRGGQAEWDPQPQAGGRIQAACTCFCPLEHGCPPQPACEPQAWFRVGPRSQAGHLAPVGLPVGNLSPGAQPMLQHPGARVWGRPSLPPSSSQPLRLCVRPAGQWGHAGRGAHLPGQERLWGLKGPRPGGGHEAHGHRGHFRARVTGLLLLGCEAWAGSLTSAGSPVEQGPLWGPRETRCMEDSQYVPFLLPPDLSSSSLLNTTRGC